VRAGRSGDRVRVSSIRMTDHTERGIAREHALEFFVSFPGSVGNDHHTRVQ
jgi:hypothetical protein